MAQRKIIDLIIEADYPLLSLEFFPPKHDDGLRRLADTAEQLKVARPDFVTVTWGAGGSTRERSLEVCDMLKEKGFDLVMPHLTCVGAGRDELGAVTDKMYDHGYRNIMALRGDPPRGEKEFSSHPDGLSYAGDLVSLIKEKHPDMCCGVAGYPETHPEAASPEADVRFLKSKVDAGGDFVTTQLFYDNQIFFDFVQRCRSEGIRTPVLPGLLPVVSLKQALRISSMCGATFPGALYDALEQAGGEGPEAEEAGVEWVVQQVEDLLDREVPGIHLYVLNRSNAVLNPSFIECLKNHRKRFKSLDRSG